MLKCYYSLFIYVHSKTEQKSHLQVLNLQCCHFDIVILRVANNKCSKCRLDCGRVSWAATCPEQ